MGINRAVVTGNLTRDADVRQTTNGTLVANFGVAVNDRRKNPQTGQWEDYPNFIDCALFGQRAEALQRYLAKGAKVAIEGKLRYSAWEDRNTGQRRSKIEIVVDDIDFIGQRQGDGGGYQQAQPRQQAQPTAPTYQQQPYQQPTYQDDGIPF